MTCPATATTFTSVHAPGIGFCHVFAEATSGPTDGLIRWSKSRTAIAVKIKLRYLMLPPLKGGVSFVCFVYEFTLLYPVLNRFISTKKTILNQ